MLLDTPSDMRCFLLVTDRVRRMFGVVPSGWIVDEDLLGLREVADWALEDTIVLKQQLGGSIDPHQAAGQSHPMHGLLTRHPIYSMLCNSQQSLITEKSPSCYGCRFLPRALVNCTDRRRTTTALTLSSTSLIPQTKTLRPHSDSRIMLALPYAS